jgi:Cu/Ag efflux pump CusA
MLPLALALDPGAQAERSLGTVVIGGLLSSLLLTLVLVPVVYLAVSPESNEDKEPKPTRRRILPTVMPSGAPKGA